VPGLPILNPLVFAFPLSLLSLFLYCGVGLIAIRRGLIRGIPVNIYAPLAAVMVSQLNVLSLLAFSQAPLSLLKILLSMSSAVDESMLEAIVFVVSRSFYLLFGAVMLIVGILGIAEKMVWPAVLDKEPRLKKSRWTKKEEPSIFHVMVIIPMKVFRVHEKSVGFGLVVLGMWYLLFFIAKLPEILQRFW